MSYHSFKSHLRGSAALAVVLGIATGLSTPAVAQTAAPATVDEIVVTGTRIVRDGYQAPTPLTVLGEEQLQAWYTCERASALDAGALPAASQ